MDAVDARRTPIDDVGDAKHEVRANIQHEFSPNVVVGDDGIAVGQASATSAILISHDRIPDGAAEALAHVVLHADEEEDHKEPAEDEPRVMTAHRIRDLVESHRIRVRIVRLVYMQRGRKKST